MYDQTNNVWQPQGLQIFSYSERPGTTLRQTLSNLNQDADAMSRSTSDLFDRALQVRVVARDANRTFIQMRDSLSEYRPVLDRAIPQGSHANKKTSHSTAPKNMLSEQQTSSTDQATQADEVRVDCQEEQMPRIVDFQETVQSLSRLQKLIDGWILTYETGFSAPQSSKGTDMHQRESDVVLGDKQHPKHFLSTIKQIQWRVYKLVPPWGRGLVYPDGKDGNKSSQEGFSLDGLGDLGLHTTESEGLSGHDVLEDRNFVNGMETLRFCLEENEIRREQDDHIEGAFSLLEQADPEDANASDDVGGGACPANRRSLH